MSSLRQQVAGLIETCQTVLAGKAKLTPVDGTTMQIAQAVLDAAKAELSTDKVVAAIKLEPTWTAVLTAMETIRRSFPLPQQAQIRVR